jgi:hypothetical protein
MTRARWLLENVDTGAQVFAQPETLLDNDCLALQSGRTVTLNDETFRLVSDDSDGI